MILETFDQEKHDEAMKKDWYEAGREDGQKEGRKLERENGIRRLITSLRKKETLRPGILRFRCSGNRPSSGGENAPKKILKIQNPPLTKTWICCIIKNISLNNILKY